MRFYSLFYRDLFVDSYFQLSKLEQFQTIKLTSETCSCHVDRTRDLYVQNLTRYYYTTQAFEYEYVSDHTR